MGQGVDAEGWEPRCAWPIGLVAPARLDPTGRTGPTRGQAQRKLWRRVAPAHYVTAAAPDCVEQRILEQSVRAGEHGAVTGWASLRVQGGTYFDGLSPGGSTFLPVPLLSTRQLPTTDESTASRAHLPADEAVVVHGIRCTRVERALSDEIERIGEIREAVVALDMACAARLTSVRRLRRYAAARLRGARRAHLLAALTFVDEWSRSPQETRMRLVWVLDAGLPRPLCNPIVYAETGDLIGSPDLLDAALGVAGEYDGAAHRSRARHRRDVERADRFRAHGIETFTIVAGDSTAVQVQRMRAARQRARRRSGAAPDWTLEPPPGAWRPVTAALDDELDRLAPWPAGFPSPSE